MLLIFDWDTNALANDARVFANENVTFDRKQTIGDSPFKWAYSSCNGWKYQNFRNREGV